jgi:hypothetical protein
MDPGDPNTDFWVIAVTSPADRQIQSYGAA